MTLTDTHTHIYSKEFDADLRLVVERAKAENVTRMFLPAIDSEYHEKMLKVAEAFPRNCFPMMGLHPTSVKNDFRDELKIVSDYFSAGKIKFQKRWFGWHGSI